jgi:hypothetical protein
MKMPKLWERPKPGRRRRDRRTTTLSLTAADLAALGTLVAIGQAVRQEKHPVVARLKAAMTRLGMTIPTGL